MKLFENKPKDTFDGYGRLYHDNGVVMYEGEITQGKKHGFGREYDEYEVLVHEGNWVNNEPKGPFKYYTGSKGNEYVVYDLIIEDPDKAKGIMFELSGSGRKTYEGEIYKAEPHGQGVKYLSGEIQYEGQFINGRFHGNGKSYWKGLLAYDGEWQAGEKHGFGREYTNNQLTFEGKWQNGKKIIN